MATELLQRPACPMRSLGSDDETDARMVRAPLPSRWACCWCHEKGLATGRCTVSAPRCGNDRVIVVDAADVGFGAPGVVKERPSRGLGCHGGRVRIGV